MESVLESHGDIIDKLNALLDEFKEFYKNTMNSVTTIEVENIEKMLKNLIRDRYQVE